MKGKAIYKPSGKAGEYSEWACNLHTGCSNDCAYCYCKRGVLSHVWSNRPRLKKCFKNEDDAIGSFIRELEANLSDLLLKGLFFSFTTDPLIKENRHLYAECFIICMRYGVPVSILTKDADFVTDRDFFMNLGISDDEKISNWLTFGFTLTGHDELEPYASTNEQRIEAMKKLHRRGYRTFASIEPVLDARSSMDMINRTRGFCDLYKIGLKSGSGYSDAELAAIEMMVEDLKHYKDITIYLKDSLVNILGIDRSTLPPHFVSRHYQILTKPKRHDRD